MDMQPYTCNDWRAHLHVNLYSDIIMDISVLNNSTQDIDWFESDSDNTSKPFNPLFDLQSNYNRR